MRPLIKSLWLSCKIRFTFRFLDQPNTTQTMSINVNVNRLYATQQGVYSWVHRQVKTSDIMFRRFGDVMTRSKILDLH